jgi:hypothetical protein
MLSLSWHKLLTMFLWVAPHLALALLLVVLCRRRLYRQFPCFFVYVVYEIAGFILMLVLSLAPSVTQERYMYAYYATLLFSIALRFGVIDEVSKGLFRESRLLTTAAGRTLRSVTVLLLGAGVLLAIYVPGAHRAQWIVGVSIVTRGAAMIQCGLLLSLLLFSWFLGMSWRRPAFGITLGLGILTSIDLAVHALRTQFTGDSVLPYLDLMTTSAYLVCVSIWVGYLWAPEEELTPLAVTPNDYDEVNTWNTALQHLLRD